MTEIATDSRFRIVAYRTGEQTGGMQARVHAAWCALLTGILLGSVVVTGTDECGSVEFDIIPEEWGVFLLSPFDGEVVNAYSEMDVVYLMKLPGHSWPVYVHGMLDGEPWFNRLVQTFECLSFRIAALESVYA